MGRMNANILVLLVSLFAPGANPAPPQASDPGRYFAIEVVDEQTGRGVPMVELQTTYGGRYYTDSAGLIAFDEPGLMGRRAFFCVAAPRSAVAPGGIATRGLGREPQPPPPPKTQNRGPNTAPRPSPIPGPRNHPP